MALEYGSGGNLAVTLAGPFGSVGSAVKLAQITLPAESWKGGVSPFSQVAALDAISVGSKVDLLPSPQQLEAFRSQELAFTTENDAGTLTVYAIGDRPKEDLTFQVSITEVTA